MGDSALLYCYAETAVHAGGSDSVGVIDLPIQRESTTRLPTIWGQSAKGALRDHAREDRKNWPDVEKVFGSAPPGSPGADTEPPKPGWLAVGDLRLVAFPVPTLRNTFAWASSPLLLARQTRMAELAGVRGLPPIPTVDAGSVVPAASFWAEPGARLAVGEYDLAAKPVEQAVTAWAGWLADNALPAAPAQPRQPTAGTANASDPFAFFRDKLRTDLLLVSDGDLAALTEEHVELLPRIQLESEAKTVKHGPWYTEYLPAETIMCSLLRDCLADTSASEPARLDGLRTRLDGELLVAGGDETLGKGLLWLRWRGKDA
ncbi:type III-B CRISPR module RAMP protein Cmr4 [Candidatus Protofrankia californiensis]|uniref:type III-B CRISPR module RAMP protein Cmr4 n=1 Tax=Candidatus Protofrankia californiensis TaxID=1839754 RepID=UPI0013EC92F5|nr:type III-B CRISPR module RAMP protein Cmr4 [Candidatus Protofrankia californiensis]